MSTKKMTVKECISEYKQTSDKIRELEKYKEALHGKLTDYMREKEQSSISNDQYVVKLSEQKREFVAKKHLPPDVWDRYRQTVNYSRLSVTSKRSG
jgi:hypothetical protein